jgi:hypothetical protein
MGLWSGCLTVGAKDWKPISAGTAMMYSLSTKVRGVSLPVSNVAGEQPDGRLRGGVKDRNSGAQDVGGTGV